MVKSVFRVGPLAAIVLLSATAFALPVRGVDPPTAPPRPTRPPVTPPTTPPAPPTPQKGFEIGGIAIGTPLDAVEAKCKANGWKCERSTRAATGVQLSRLHINIPSGGEYRGFIVGATGGTVISVKAYYRAPDPQRLAALTKTYGAPASTSAKGETQWTWNNTSIVLSPGGGYLLAVGHEPAKKGGFVFTGATFFGDKANRVPAQTFEVAQFADAAPSISGEKISVKITLDKLQCYDEQDATSVFHGDDPHLYVTAVHTDSNRAATNGLPWALHKSYSDVESDKSSRDQKVDKLVFNSAADPRNVVRSGEAVAIHAVVKEDDSLSYDDEVGFDIDLLSFSMLKANAGKTLSRVITMKGDGGYKLYYRVEIGQPSPDARIQPALARVNPKQWEGAYGWVMDGWKDNATLRFNAPTAAFPDGSISGSWTENGKTLSIVTKRLFGNYMEFELVGAGIAPGSRKMVGYFVGTPQAPALAGTGWNGGVAYGFYMNRK